MFPLATTIALIALSAVALVLVEHWRAIRASDRMIDELARGLPYDDPALNDDLVAMLDAWAIEERVRLIRACFERVDTPPDRVEP